KLDDITDDHESTVMLVEVADSGLHWMEPRDLHILQMAPTINPKGGRGMSSRHAAGPVRTDAPDFSPRSYRLGRSAACSRSIVANGFLNTAIDLFKAIRSRIDRAATSLTTAAISSEFPRARCAELRKR